MRLQKTGCAQNLPLFSFSIVPPLSFAVPVP